MPSCGFAFLAEYPEARGYVLYGGTRRYHFDAIDVLPFGDAITNLSALLRVD
jgi:hypothetical protein